MYIPTFETKNKQISINYLSNNKLMRIANKYKNCTYDELCVAVVSRPD